MTHVHNLDQNKHKETYVLNDQVIKDNINCDPIWNQNEQCKKNEPRKRQWPHKVTINGSNLVCVQKELLLARGGSIITKSIITMIGYEI